MSQTRPRHLSRREFLKTVSLFTTAGVLAACPVTGRATQRPTIPTGAQRLQKEFNLTRLTAQTFWLFVANRDEPLGRREIANQLNISSNTLKDRITRIIRHVRLQGYPEVARINDAVTLAVTVLALDSTGNRVE
jgi:hypothetical protein